MFIKLRKELELYFLKLFLKSKSKFQKWEKQTLDTQLITLREI